MAANSHEIPFKLDQGNDDGVIKLIFFAFKNREFNNHKKKIVFEGQLQEATTMRNLF